MQFGSIMELSWNAQANGYGTIMDRLGTIMERSSK
jgi:hypothetical protein